MHNNGRMLGVIGGSGFYTFFGSDTRTVNSDTPYGQPSAPITIGTIGVHDVAFLPRHGAHHQYSAHAVPYRANMWALRALWCAAGLRAVCGRAAWTLNSSPARSWCPISWVDRTSGRADTYFDFGRCPCPPSPIRTAPRCGPR
ncbi:5'-methylthioadenosine phosphorylase [Mycobacterium tuberculosis T46]|nr:5'-methylthioadenosine phosphorylase [Mycobacterium tuberculosis T46]